MKRSDARLRSGRWWPGNEGAEVCRAVPEAAEAQR